MNVWNLINIFILKKSDYIILATMFQSKSMPKSVKLKLKGGGYVDPDSGLEDKVNPSHTSI